MSKKTAGKPLANLAGGNADVERMRGVLETLFENNPHIRKEINGLWGLIEGMSKGIGSLNELVGDLEKQRDEQVAINTRQWDEGYEAGEKVGAFMQGRDVFTQEILTDEISDMLYGATYVDTDFDDARLFAEALMKGDMESDEGQLINHLVAVVAERVRQQQEEALEGERNE